MCKNILYIHGSGQSPISWSYFNVFLPEHNAVEVAYNVSESAEEICKAILPQLSKFNDQPFSIVAHSYGCLLAAVLYTMVDRVDNIIALSPPWGGSQTAKWLGRAFRDNNLFKNTTPNSTLLEFINTVNIPVPVTNIVTTGGENVLAGFGKPNDGMVTVDSQRSIPETFTQTISHELSLSHSEVLLSYDVINIITETLFTHQ